VNTYALIGPLVVLALVVQTAVLVAILLDRSTGRVSMRLHNVGAWTGAAMLLLALAWGVLGITVSAIVALSGWFALLHRCRDHERAVARDVERALRDGSLTRGPAPRERPERSDGDAER
jgi:hypothetical protein